MYDDDDPGDLTPGWSLALKILGLLFIAACIYTLATDGGACNSPEDYPCEGQT